MTLCAYRRHRYSRQFWKACPRLGVASPASLLHASDLRNAFSLVITLPLKLQSAFFLSFSLCFDGFKNSETLPNPSFGTFAGITDLSCTSNCCAVSPLPSILRSKTFLLQ